MFSEYKHLFIHRFHEQVFKNQRIIEGVFGIKYCFLNCNVSMKISHLVANNKFISIFFLFFIKCFKKVKLKHISTLKCFVVVDIPENLGSFMLERNLSHSLLKNILYLKCFIAVDILKKFLNSFAMFFI